MSETYKAVEVSSPGVFTVVHRELVEPQAHQVRIRVEACGVCHSDAATYANALPGLTFPRVSGHEVVGRIDAVGSQVSAWKIGQRVGVGFLAGPCLECGRCRMGDFATCERQNSTGIHVDGGYAEMMIAKETGLCSIPDGLSSVDAAPLLCAGVTTFNALRASGADAGDLVAVQGIGGLGHLAVKFAVAMGFQVAAIGRGDEKRAASKALGAHHYIDTLKESPSDALLALGGSVAIIATASTNVGMGDLLKGLKPRGKLIVVGVGTDGPMPISAIDLVFGLRTVEGSLTGSSADCEKTLQFSDLQKISPVIETMPLDQAAEAFGKMMEGKANLRIVLTMD